MDSTTITEQAVETAALAMFQIANPHSNYSAFHKEDYEELAQVALTAALPHLRTEGGK